MQEVKLVPTKIKIPVKYIPVDTHVLKTKHWYKNGYELFFYEPISTKQLQKMVEELPF